MPDAAFAWNVANHLLQSNLAKDPAFQAVALEVEPEFVLWVIVEPGQRLSAGSRLAIESAQAQRRIEIAESPVGKADLLRAREAIEVGLRLAAGEAARVGRVGISTEWRIGRVRIAGDVEFGNAVVAASDVDPALVEVVPRAPIVLRADPPRAV